MTHTYNIPNRLTITPIAIFNRSMIIRRHYSGLYPSLLGDPYEDALKQAIESIYNEREWSIRGLLPFRKAELLHSICHNKNYCFSSGSGSGINAFRIKESAIPPVLYRQILLESNRGYLGYEPWIGDEYPYQVGLDVYHLSSAEDLLLSMSLSQVFYNKIIQGLPGPNINRHYDLKEAHYDFIGEQENVCKLYKIDLTPCIKHISRDRLLNSFKFIHDIRILYDLIKGYLELSINDTLIGLPFKSRGIPPAGELTALIYHVFYQQAFDRILEELYPGICYTRWGHQVFIAIKESNTFLSDEIDVQNILEMLDLAGNIESVDSTNGGYLIGLEEDRVLLLDGDGCVDVFRTEDFI